MTMELILALAAFGFLCQALKIEWHIGRLTIAPGWLGLTVWGIIAALRAAVSSDDDGDVAIAPELAVVIGAVLATIATVSMIVTLRTKIAVGEVHDLVNDQSDKQNDRIDQLTASMKE